MGSKHELIVRAVVTSWSVDRRGRLYTMQQGTFRALHSEEIIRISPYPKKQGGFPDIFGFEFDNRYIKPFPIYCVVEVKTFAHPDLSPDQINYLNYAVSIGARAYVAREADNEVGYVLEVWAPCS